MKRFFTLIAVAFALTNAFAEDTFVFCYENGTVIPNGSTVNIETSDATAVAESFGMLESGVFVKNTKGNDEIASLSFNITELSEGSSLMVCLGTNCHNYEKVGTNAIQNVTLSGGGIYDLLTHWSPFTEDWETFKYGMCSVTMTIQHVSGSVVDCSTITINFSFGESTSIKNFGKSGVNVVEYYSLTGEKVSAGQKGIVFQMMSDGSVRKAIVK